MYSTASPQNPWTPCSPIGRAAIYNRYLRTLGGGERSCIEYARALEDLGYKITLITDPGSDISVEKLCSAFGILPRSNWSIAEVKPGDLELYCRDTGQDVFVNHTYSSYIPSATSNGLYLLMFPHQISPEQLEALRTYKAILCISPFVELYLKLRWGANLPVVVLPPPISDSHFENNFLATKKEKLVLNIGRFNVDGHSKCQKEAIENFIRLKKEGIFDPDWQMVVAGHLNKGRENQEYFDLCASLAPDIVSVQKNISFDQLKELYSRASVLFQFTGYGLDFGVIPERCEHLGLVAMDALCYGTIPVVYDRSGAALFTDWGDSIYSFGDILELQRIITWINSDYGLPSHFSHMRRCRAEALKYSYNKFYSNLAKILAG